MLLLALLPVVALLLHVGGPRFFGWFTKASIPLGDYFEWLLPWHKLRVQRDFISLLGLLLDAGVDEKEAVEMAAKGTANVCCVKAARAVSIELSKGMTLTEALIKMDDHGEFKWRFEQAAQGGARFETALNGWCDSLTGRADQWQQTVTHIFSVTILLLNACLVGMIAFGVFGFLMQMIDLSTE
jgi:type II secretory pathway component PulF